MEKSSLEKESIEFQVQIEPKDFITFNLYFMWKKFRGLLILLLFIWSIAILNFFIQGFFNFFLFIPLFIIISLLLILKNSKNKNLYEHGTGTYIVNSEGISLQSEKMSATFKWNSIIEIWKTKKFIYLFTSPQTALIIPIQILTENQIYDKMIGFLPTIKKGKKRNSAFLWVLLLLLGFLVIVGLVSFFNGVSANG